MSLESPVNYLNDLNVSNPTTGDPRSEGDDHLRNIKTAAKATFPGMAGRYRRTASKSANYTALTTDNTVALICTAALTLSLTAAGTLGNGYELIAYANGADVTIDPNAVETINGSATATLKDGTAALMLSDGSNIHAFALPKLSSAGAATFGGGIASAALTSGRIPYATTGGLLTDTANLTISAGVVTATGFTGALNGTLGATTPAAATVTTLTASGSITSSVAPSSGSMKRDVDNSYLELFGGTAGNTSAALILTGPSYAAASTAFIDATETTIRTLNGAAEIATFSSTGLAVGAAGSVLQVSGGMAGTVWRIREKSSTDMVGFSTNENDAGTQDDATKASWKMEMGYGAGNDLWRVARRPAAGAWSTFLELSVSGLLTAYNGLAVTGSLSATGAVTFGDGSAAVSEEVKINGGSNASRGARLLFQRGGSGATYIGHAGSLGITGNDADLAIVAEASRSLLLSAGGSATPYVTLDSSGNLMVGTTSATPAQSNVAGIAFKAGSSEMSADGTQPLFLNRKTDDGEILAFFQDGTKEGSVSISGTTISYNAFLGSHWSQLSDGSKPAILRGTVMETLDEMCVWPRESNDRLPKSKISDTAASRSVYGVFLGWDNDDERTNDMYVAALGAGYIRMQAGQVVQRGDLVESAGDGTARVQADDIVRASTLGKITSPVKQETYVDGSFVVPCVLYAG